MINYKSIKGCAYALALGTALWGCGDNISNNQYDLNNKTDVSTPDTKTLETILEDAGVEVNSKEDSYEPDAQIDSDSYVPPEDVLRTDYTQINQDQIPSGEWGTDGSPNTDYNLNGDIIGGDYALPDAQEDDLVLVDLSQEDQIAPSEDINLEEDLSTIDADNCANNHAPTLEAHAEPPSGSTINETDKVEIFIDSAEDLEDNPFDCIAVYSNENGEQLAKATDIGCDRGSVYYGIRNANQVTVEVYAEDKPCNEKSESIFFYYTVNK